MSRQTQSFLIARMKEAGIRPQGQHGQNFLIDLNLLDLLVRTADLGPKDVVSFPIGVHRRFECVDAAAGKSEGLLLAVIAGEAPEAEYSPEARQRMADAGAVLQPA